MVNIKKINSKWQWQANTQKGRDFGVKKQYRGLIYLFILMTSFMLVACSSTAPTTPAPKAVEQAKPAAATEVNTDYVVNAAWLKSHLKDSSLLILDARGKDAHGKGHISGAIAVDWKELANMEGSAAKVGFGELLKPDALSAKLAGLGVDSSKTVIVYADPNAWGEDGRILWTLRLVGVKNSKLLDGGWEAWTKSDGNVAKDEIKPATTTFKVAAFQEDTLATTDWLRDNYKKVVLLDVRHEKEFKGEKEYGEKRSGHIPGSINIEFKEFMDPTKTYAVKTPAEIEQILSSKGIKKSDTIVTICTAGIRSAHTAMVLKSAGYQNVKNYDASIWGWAADASLPMEK